MSVREDWNTGDLFTAADANSVAAQVNADAATLDTFTATGLAVASAANEAAARAAIGASGHLYVNVKDYGAVGDGVTDDTDAINDAATAVGNVGTLFFPAGNFVYNGSGLPFPINAPIRIQGVGAGRGANDAVIGTQITLGASSRLIDISYYLYHLSVRDMRITGGLGAIRHTYSSVNVQQKFIVENVDFREYTECAVSTDAADMPYWVFRDCMFRGANTTSTIGVALGGNPDNCSFDGCAFEKNRVGIKAHWGNNIHITNTSFLHFSADNSGGPRMAVWIVANTSSTNSGNGLTISSCKFGNENLVAGDYWVVCADEGSGTYNGDTMPNLGADSTGYLTGLNIFGCYFAGITAGSTPPIIYSTTPYISGVMIHHNHVTSQPNYAIQTRTASTIPSYVNSDNLVGPFSSQVLSTSFATFPASNTLGLAKWDDPLQVNVRPETVAQYSSGAASGFGSLLSASITTAGQTGGASKSTITDAYGGSDAILLTFGTSTVTSAYLALSAFRVDVPLWIELDVANNDDGLSVGSFGLMIRDSNAAYHWRRYVNVPTVAQGWVTYAFQFVPRTVGNLPTYFQIGAPDASSSGKTARVGRVRVYQSNERQIGGQRPAIAAAATDAATTQTLANDLRSKLIDLGIISA